MFSSILIQDAQQKKATQEGLTNQQAIDLFHQAGKPPKTPEQRAADLALKGDLAGSERIRNNQQAAQRTKATGDTRSLAQKRKETPGTWENAVARGRKALNIKDGSDLDQLLKSALYVAEGGKSVSKGTYDAIVKSMQTPKGREMLRSRVKFTNPDAQLFRQPDRTAGLSFDMESYLQALSVGGTTLLDKKGREITFEQADTELKGRGLQPPAVQPQTEQETAEGMARSVGPLPTDGLQGQGFQDRRDMAMEMAQAKASAGAKNIFTAASDLVSPSFKEGRDALARENIEDGMSFRDVLLNQIKAQDIQGDLASATLSIGSAGAGAGIKALAGLDAIDISAQLPGAWARAKTQGWQSLPEVALILVAGSFPALDAIRGMDTGTLLKSPQFTKFARRSLVDAGATPEEAFRAVSRMQEDKAVAKAIDELAQAPEVQRGLPQNTPDIPKATTTSMREPEIPLGSPPSRAAQSTDQPAQEAGFFRGVKNAVRNRGGDADDPALDGLLDELSSVGADISEDGTITLYHRTTPENAASIRRTGEMFGEEDGLFFSTRPDGQATGYGDEVVIVKANIEDVTLDDIFDNEAHLKLSAEPGQPRTVSVEPDTSGANATQTTGVDETLTETPNKVDNVKVPEELKGKVDETFLGQKANEWERRLAELQAKPKKPRTKESGGLDPDVLEEAVLRAGILIARAGEPFEQAIRAVLKEMGLGDESYREVREALDGEFEGNPRVWDPEYQQTQAAPAARANVAENERAAAEFGLGTPDLETGSASQYRQQIGEQNLVNRSTELVTRVQRGDALNAAETLALGDAAASRQAELKSIAVELATARRAGDQQSIRELEEAFNRLKEDAKEHSDAFRQARRKAGQALQVGNNDVLRDAYDPATVQTMAEAVSPGGKVHPDLQADLDRLTTRNAELEAEVARLQQEGARAQADDLIKQRRGSRSGRSKQAVQQSFKKNLDTFYKEFEKSAGGPAGSGIPSVPKFTDAQKEALKGMLGDLVELGKLTLDEVVDTIRAELRTMTGQDYSKQDIIDALGETKPAPRRSDVQKKIAGLKREARNNTTGTKEQRAARQKIIDAKKKARAAQKEREALEAKAKKAAGAKAQQAAKAQEAMAERRAQQSARAQEKLSDKAAATEAKEQAAAQKALDDAALEFDNAADKARAEQLAKDEKYWNDTIKTLQKQAEKEFGEEWRFHDRIFQIEEEIAALQDQLATGEFRKPVKPIRAERDKLLEEKMAELAETRRNIDRAIAAAEPSGTWEYARLTARGLGFTNPVARVFDVTANAFKMAYETASKPVDFLIESVMFPGTKKGTALPSYRRAREASKGYWGRVGNRMADQYKHGDNNLLQKIDIRKQANLKQRFENPTARKIAAGVDAAVNFFNRTPGYTDIPFHQRAFDIAVQEGIDNEVAYMTKANKWGKAEAEAFRAQLMANENGLLEPIQLAAQEIADELVWANTTAFDELMSNIQSGVKRWRGKETGEGIMFAFDTLITRYPTIFAKILGYGTDHVPLVGLAKAGKRLWGLKKAGVKASPQDQRIVAALVRRNMVGTGLTVVGAQLAADGVFDEYIEINKDTGYVDFGDLDQLGGPMSIILRAYALEKIDRMDITPSQKQTLRNDVTMGLYANQPIIGGTENVVRNYMNSRGNPTKATGQIIANTVIPAGIRELARRSDPDPDSKVFGDSRRVNTKPVPEEYYTNSKGEIKKRDVPWAEQDQLQVFLNQFKARIPGTRKQFPTQK